MTHYQMTLEEMLDPGPKKPTRERGAAPGTFCYKCPICEAIVGIKGAETYHEPGWLHRRDQCKNGHFIDWSKTK